MVGAWIALIMVVGVIGQAVGVDFGGDPEAPESESRTGFEILEDNFDNPSSGFGGTIVIQAEQGVDDPAVQAAFTEITDLADSLDEVTVQLPGDPGAINQIATEGDQAGKIAFARVEISDELTFEESGELGGDLRDAADRLEGEVDGLRIEIGGEALAGFEPPSSEVIGLAFAIVVLIISFGSVLAMGLPIAVALAGVSLGITLTGIISNVTVMPDFATVIGAMIGLGVGIDYALFIVTRYREGLHKGYDPETATVAAQDTAGRAVIFAGVTVVVSLLGLLLIGLEFVAGLGIGAAVTVLSTMIASTTLLPALLGFAKLRIEVTRWRGLIAAGLLSPALLVIGLNQPPVIALALVALSVATIVAGFFVPALRREVPKRERKPIEESGWYKWSHLIQDRPWPFLIGGVAVLLFLATPLLGIRLGFSDEGNYPEESTTRQAYDLLSEGFGPGFNGPFLAVTELDGPEGLADFAAVVRAIEADPGVAEVRPSTAAGDPIDGLPNDLENPTAAQVFVVPASSPQSLETEETIKRLRADVIPAAEADASTEIDTNLTGFVPVSVDFSSYLGGRSLLFFGVVLLLSFVLLMAVFRSLLVPLKAVIMNGLSIAGAYGVVVALFQWGHLGSITGIEPAPIEPFIPMMMFAIVFGLSMDYEVFLLSRVKEEYERTGDPKNSVADGLASTARVISAAAAIMVVVFGSFLLEDARVTKLFGVGLSVAVFLDATLVRMLLVPATMELLGKRNWWIPAWLDKALPRLYVEGAPDHEEQIAAMRAEIAAEQATAGDEPVPAGV
ncbi:MMPL family transporter [Actinospongicola halichondriae]|uniref:MMPL family transporter n=1 Tax=Actinospongicola halichondriae TaxID=3236844 RepID=UPI003D531F3B